MTEIPHMPFYPADYLADTMHLNLEEHGAYTKLLFVMWRAGGWLDDNDKFICQILGISTRKWRLIDKAIRPFFDMKNGKFTQKRLLSEHQNAVGKRLQKVNAGSIGGKAKSQKTNDPPLADATVSLLAEGEQNPSKALAIRAGTQNQNQNQIKAEVPESLPRDPEPPGKSPGAIADALGIILNSPIPLIYAPVIAWLEWGADYELDIKPAAERWKRKNPDKALNSLKWLDEDVARNLDQRKATKPVMSGGKASASTTPSEPETDAAKAKRLAWQRDKMTGYAVAPHDLRWLEEWEAKQQVEEMA